ncbi:hypothetical protein ECC02_002649 [Trypanosoma cruzi]|nr:hypothetical protein ECC02_002649 [Trypanosoma cruzi]
MFIEGIFTFKNHYYYFFFHSNFLFIFFSLPYILQETLYLRLSFFFFFLLCFKRIYLVDSLHLFFLCCETGLLLLLFYFFLAFLRRFSVGCRGYVKFDMNKQLLQTLPLAKGKDIHSRVAKLALYKECIALAKNVGDPLVRQHTLVEVREKWMQNRGCGGHSLQLQIASALDRISYGRMCVSKQRLRLIPNASEKYDWGVSNPLEYHEQRLTKRSEKESPDAFPHGAGKRDFVPMTNWGYGNMDPDAVMRHKELTDRQHFIGPHWRGKPKPMVLEDLSFEEQLHVHFQSKPKMKKTPKKHY